MILQDFAHTLFGVERLEEVSIERFDTLLSQHSCASVLFLLYVKRRYYTGELRVWGEAGCETIEEQSAYKRDMEKLYLFFEDPFWIQFLLEQKRDIFTYEDMEVHVPERAEVSEKKNEPWAEDEDTDLDEPTVIEANMDDTQAETMPVLQADMSTETPMPIREEEVSHSEAMTQESSHPFVADCTPIQEHTDTPPASLTKPIEVEKSTYAPPMLIAKNERVGRKKGVINEEVIFMPMLHHKKKEVEKSIKQTTRSAVLSEEKIEPISQTVHERESSKLAEEMKRKNMVDVQRDKKIALDPPTELKAVKTEQNEKLKEEMVLRDEYKKEGTKKSHLTEVAQESVVPISEHLDKEHVKTSTRPGSVFQSSFTRRKQVPPPVAPLDTRKNQTIETPSPSLTTKTHKPTIRDIKRDMLPTFLGASLRKAKEIALKKPTPSVPSSLPVKKSPPTPVLKKQSLNTIPSKKIIDKKEPKQPVEKTQPDTDKKPLKPVGQFARRVLEKAPKQEKQKEPTEKERAKKNTSSARVSHNAAHAKTDKPKSKTLPKYNAPTSEPLSNKNKEKAKKEDNAPAILPSQEQVKNTHSEHKKKRSEPKKNVVKKVATRSKNTDKSAKELPKEMPSVSNKVLKPATPPSMNKEKPTGVHDFSYWLKNTKKVAGSAGVHFVQEKNEDLDLYTETMATLYEKQGSIAKAIAVYEKLLVQNPQKKAVFSKKITQLKKQL